MGHACFAAVCRGVGAEILVHQQGSYSGIVWEKELSLLEASNVICRADEDDGENFHDDQDKSGCCEQASSKVFSEGEASAASRMVSELAETKRVWGGVIDDCCIRGLVFRGVSEAAFEVGESGELAVEVKLDRSDRAVALFGDDDFGDVVYFLAALHPS